MNVTTKAKLDEITVAGSCECADVPPPIIDVVVLVDGSDSYNNKGIENYRIASFGQTSHLVNRPL